MTPVHIIQSLFEILAIALLIVGFIFEDKVIDFETEIKRIILGNLRHAIRTHHSKKTHKNEDIWYNYQ